MDIAVGCWLSSVGGRSSFFRSHCPLEGDLAAVSALQLQGKKQTDERHVRGSPAAPDLDEAEQKAQL